jgi:cytochrome c oxidase subunit 2
VRDVYDRLLDVYAPIAIAVVLIVLVAYAVIVVRFRDRGDGAEPRRSRDRPALEIGYAVLLAAIAGGLVAVSLPALHDSRALADHPGLTVDVTASQWGWAFAYPGTGVAVRGSAPDRPALVVPAGTPVRLRMRSLDVVHAFWVPEERLKRDIFPDAVTEIDLRVDEPGVLTGECAEFCGLRHSEMGFRVVAMRPGAFADWLRARERRA